MGWGIGNIGSASSGGLNFKIVGGSSAPNNPDENTIWVNTEKHIPSWSFSFDEPTEISDGMVWVSVGVRGYNVFNALKRNAICVSPMDTKQYIDGKWQGKKGKIYMDGKWNDFVYYLIQNGEPLHPLKLLGKSYDSTYKGSWTSANSVPGDGYIKISGGSGGFGIAYISDVDLTNFNTLTIDGTFHSSNERFKMIVWDGLGETIAENMVRYSTLPNGSGKVSLDVSGLTGVYTVGISSASNYEQIIKDFYLT